MGSRATAGRWGTGLGAVATELLAECGMIFGARFPDTAEAELASSVLSAPEAACSRISTDPVLNRNRTNEVNGSDFVRSGHARSMTHPGWCGTCKRDLETRRRGSENLNLLSNFDV